jgi:hypothetical protein
MITATWTDYARPRPGLPMITVTCTDCQAMITGTCTRKPVDLA